MKTKFKLKEAIKNFQAIDTNYVTENEGLSMCTLAMEQMSNIIELQRIRIAELEDNIEALYRSL